MSLTELRQDLQDISTEERAKTNAWFFKTGKGQYGEGDKFLGITVPDTRTIAKKYKDLPFADVSTLLQSEWHEERLTALLILVHNFERGNDQEKIVEFYLQNTQRVNNWDLVDLSADKIVGAWLFDKDKSILYDLAKSTNLWERRIAIMSTFYFIRHNQFEDTLKIAELLLHDPHDLIHKAVGWMLREIGKRNQDVEETFLKKHYKTMPRTMLRYAIEKFSKEKRDYYMGR